MRQNSHFQIKFFSAQTGTAQSQRTNGLMALYDTFAHNIWPFVSCVSVVLSLKQSKNASEHVQRLLSSPAWGGNGLNLWTDCHTDSRGWGGVGGEGSPWAKASVALQWHQGIGDIILLLYAVCCNGLSKLRVDLSVLGCPAEPQRTERKHDR